jgi:hypothetical protein
VRWSRGLLSGRVLPGHIAVHERGLTPALCCPSWSSMGEGPLRRLGMREPRISAALRSEAATRRRRRASREVWHAATQAYETCWHWGDALDNARVVDELRRLQGAYNEEVAVLLAAIRSDLGVGNDSDGSLDFDQSPRG